MKDQDQQWIIIPALDCVEMTLEAVADALDQAGSSSRVLLINNGGNSRTREHFEWAAEEYGGRLLVWHHGPPLPSLSATWNHALDFAWATGAEEAMVMNNDVRINPLTLACLSAARAATGALFVSAVAVTKEQYEGNVLDASWWAERADPGKGGPDFSCYLISKEGHQKYRFDEGFIPLFCEDLDMHRRYMLGGDGERIFSINVPYFHHASGTLKSMEAGKREAVERRINAGSRVYYEKKWGGGVNEEKFTQPFGEFQPARELCPKGCVTTPQLQSHGCGGRAK